MACPSGRAKEDALLCEIGFVSVLTRFLSPIQAAGGGGGGGGGSGGAAADSGAPVKLAAAVTMADSKDYNVMEELPVKPRPWQPRP